MSVWADIHRRSNGVQERKEDQRKSVMDFDHQFKGDYYFKLNNLSNDVHCLFRAYVPESISDGVELITNTINNVVRDYGVFDEVVKVPYGEESGVYSLRVTKRTKEIIKELDNRLYNLGIYLNDCDDVLTASAIDE